MKNTTQNIQIQNAKIEILENQISKIPLLEQEIHLFKREIQLLKQNQFFIQKDVFMVFFTLENTHHKLVCAKNPILGENVVFFIKFEQEEEAKEFEESVFSLLKLQKAHLKDDLFFLEKRHLLFLENTKSTF